MDPVDVMKRSLASWKTILALFRRLRKSKLALDWMRNSWMKIERNPAWTLVWNLARKMVKKMNVPSPPDSEFQDQEEIFEIIKMFTQDHRYAI